MRIKWAVSEVRLAQSLHDFTAFSSGKDSTAVLQTSGIHREHTRRTSLPGVLVIRLKRGSHKSTIDEEVFQQQPSFSMVFSTTAKLNNRFFNHSQA
jgi:hypothetical protein